MGFSTWWYGKFRTFWLANPESLDWWDFDNSNTPRSLGLSPPVSQIMVGICHMGFSLKLINVWFRRGLLGQSTSELTNVALEFGTALTSQYRVTYPYPILWSALRGSVMSDSLWRPGLQPAWDSPGKNTGGVATPFSRGSSRPRDWICISFIAGRFFTTAPGISVTWGLQETEQLVTARVLDSWVFWSWY